MFEKDLKKAYLLDFYGDILSERQKEILKAGGLLSYTKKGEN